MNRCIELLTGAGNMDSAKAAISAGCDALYLGLKEFGARRMADNFTLAELAELTALARKLDKRIYLTMNTLVKDGEVASFLDSVKKAGEAGADALIMQDPGMIKLVRDAFPGFPIHASTQTNIHNSAAFEILGRYGVRRVILSRECTLDEIRSMCRVKGPQIEVFVFGALCSAVSGVCYMSSFATDRSGNRGLCTQMCRLGYCEPGGKKGFFLSTRDISMLPLINDYIASGVTSMKIEGRGRSSAYIYNATRVLRKAIDLSNSGRYDSRAAAGLAEEAARTYNRSFSTGYSLGREKADVIDSSRNGNRGLMISSKITRFDPLRNIIEFVVSAGFAKNDVLCVEDASGARASFSIASIRDDRGRIVYTANAGEKVEVGCLPAAPAAGTDKTEEQGKCELKSIVPEKVFLIYSEEASSIRKIKFDSAIAHPDGAASHAVSEKRLCRLKIDVGLDGKNISADISCDRGKFKYFNELKDCFVAEKNPLDNDTLTRTFLQFDRGRFGCHARDLSFESGGVGYFVPLSLLKRAGKDIFGRFEADYEKRQSEGLEKCLLSFPAESECVPSALKVISGHSPAIPDVRLSLFSSENVEVALKKYFSEISFSSDHLFDLIEAGGLEDMVGRFGDSRAKLVAELSPVLFESDTDRFISNVSVLARAGITRFIAGNLSHFNLLARVAGQSSVPLEVMAGQQLNSINLRSLLFFLSHGASEAEISFELGGPETIGLLKTAEKSAPWALKYFRARLFGNLQVANFAYDIFERNPGISHLKHKGPQDRRFKTTELSFNNGSHYVVHAGASRSLAFSSGVLNNTQFAGGYAAAGIRKFSISLFNYSRSFERDLNAAYDFSESLKDAFKVPLAPGGPELSPVPFGVIKDRTLS